MSQYIVECANIGTIAHGMHIGVSLLQGGVVKYDLPWYVIFTTNPNEIWTTWIPFDSSGIAPGTYDVVCRVWKSYNPGNKLGDLISDSTVLGAVYEGGTGALYGDTPGDGVYLDQATLTWEVTPGEVSMQILSLTIQP